jgi:hypothetical protein
MKIFGNNPSPLVICQTLTLRESYSKKHIIFGHNTKEITVGLRQLYDEELHNFTLHTMLLCFLKQRE